MGYLSNGDFTFPLTWPVYALKLFYMWSYQSGAANPDGIIRMPARLLNFLVFVLFGNLAFEYFYIFSSLAIVFVCFYVFARSFLHIKSQRILLVTSLFYTINPVFLGNLSKLGLVLAVGLLPLCILLIKKFYDGQQVRYLFFWSLLLNVSLIHPYTFAINAAVSGGYFIYKALKNFDVIKHNMLSIIGLCAVVGLLNLYFVLPIASVGTISKDVISSDASVPTDYTTIIDIANTGDVFTGLTLTKNVFVDYDFYNYGYEKVYLVGIFVLYFALFGTYLINQRLLKPQYKAIFALAVGSFLVLVMMATVEFMHIDVLIKMLVSLPGGWMFRSPLKWQLYIPLSMCILMVISLATLRDKRHIKIAYSALAVSFVLINSYIGFQVYQRLLTPKHVSTFQSMQNLDMDYKNVLYITGTQCQDYTLANRKVMAELAQVFLSKNVQVKQYPVQEVDKLNLTSFAYILTCQQLSDSTIAENRNYKLVDSYDGKAFQLYANTENMDYAYIPYMVNLDKQSNIPDKYSVVKNVLPNRPVDFALDTISKGASASLQNIYEGLNFSQISGGAITSTVKTNGQVSSKLLIKNNTPSLYYSLNNGTLNISPQSSPAATAVQNGAIDLPHTASKPLQVTYRDADYDYKNLVPNPSFEQGSWQKTVSKCYADKDMSDVAMDLNKTDKTEGSQSLELSAQEQIACVSSQSVQVVPGQRYLLQFDYKSSGGRFAGYRVTYNNNDSEVVPERFANTKGDWSTYTKDFVVPDDAKTMRVTVYAYPDSKNKLPGVALYDNFKLAHLPDITQSFYAMSQTAPATNTATIRKVTHDNPTRKIIQVHTTGQPFNIVTRDTFSSSWEMSVKNGGNISSHFKDASNTNAWYVQPAAICSASNGNCTHNSDGTYDIALTVSYAPQKWFGVGMVISSLTAVGVVLYFARGILPKKQVTKSVWKARH
jgi:hypothetical protein